MYIFLVIAAAFLLCWLLDKGFTKVFRGKTQHLSGKSVRLNKYYGLAGLVLSVVGIAAIFNGISDIPVLAAGGGLLVAVGIFLMVYYLSFGVYYDADTFLFSSFGKKSQVYRYSDICGQLLYNNAGRILIELHMKDGRALQLQNGMIDVYPFLDHAFAAWCVQKGIDPEACEFHDPDNSLWFPMMEG